MAAIGNNVNGVGIHEYIGFDRELRLTSATSRPETTSQNKQVVGRQFVSDRKCIELQFKDQSNNPS